MADRERIERIERECAETRANGWWGDYPVEDVEFLLRKLKEAEDRLLESDG